VAEQARKEFEEELKMDPAIPRLKYVLGELARQAQQWDEAVQHFRAPANSMPHSVTRF